MKQKFRKLLISFLITTIFFLWAYYLIGLYDQTGTTILRIKTNIMYLYFLFISIVISISLFWNEDNKSQFMLWFIFLINILYVVFFFIISNIWLTNNESYFLIWFLMLALVGSFIKNTIWHVVTIFSVFWILLTVFISLVPLYEVWPDIKWFEHQFSPQLIVFSKATINEDSASISVDNKVFNILNWLNNYNLNLNNSWSQILFKSDKKYLSTFAYILLPNQNFIQIYPQSAININKNYQIEILDWMVKHYPSLSWSKLKNNEVWFTFTGENMSFGLINIQDASIVSDFYKEELKTYITKQIWWDFMKNKTITNISLFLLNILNKILPNQFWKNLQNFKEYQKYIQLNFDQELIQFDNDAIKKDILKWISDSINTTQIIN